MKYIGFFLLVIILIKPCFAQEGYSDYYVNTFSGIQAGKEIAYQSADEAVVILNESGIYFFPTQVENQTIILSHPQMQAFLNFAKESQASWNKRNSFPESRKAQVNYLNGSYPETYKAFEDFKTLKQMNIKVGLQQYPIETGAGFEIEDTYQADSLNAHLQGMNNDFSIPMFAGGPHGGGGGVYDMAVGPHGGGGGAYIKAYQGTQEGISKKELEQRMQKAGIEEQISLNVVNGVKNLAMYKIADFLEASDTQMDFGSIYSVPKEDFVKLIMEAQKNIQEYEHDNSFRSNIIMENIWDTSIGGN